MVAPRRTHCRQGHELEGNRIVTAKGTSDGCIICRRARRPRLTPEQIRAKWLKYEYGMSVEEYQARLEAQNYCCAICDDSFVDMPPQHINVDHDHNTGRVRGLLCRYCNNGLGHFRDDPARLLNAIQYLESNNYETE